MIQKVMGEMPPEARDWKHALVFLPGKAAKVVQTKVPEKLKIYESQTTVKVAEYVFLFL